MDELNLFIDYHYKSIVSIIRARHILTLHLFPANCRKLKHSHWQLQERSCMLCNFYQIESYHSSSRCNPVSMQINGTLILLYFKELTSHVWYHLFPPSLERNKGKFEKCTEMSIHNAQTKEISKISQMCHVSPSSSANKRSSKSKTS